MWRLRSHSQTMVDASGHRHGTLAGYVIGCGRSRCCRAGIDCKGNGSRRMLTKDIAMSFLCSEKWEPHMSMGQIARAAGVSKAQCRHALHALEDEGRIKLRSRPGAVRGALAVELVA